MKLERNRICHLCRKHFLISKLNEKYFHFTKKDFILEIFALEFLNRFIPLSIKINNRSAFNLSSSLSEKDDRNTMAPTFTKISNQSAIVSRSATNRPTLLLVLCLDFC